MSPTHCPKCKEELGRIEQLEGKCLCCGERFERSFSASHGNPEDSPYHPSHSIREPMKARQVGAIVLLLVFLATLATPIGMVYSCYVGVQKGASLGAASGCTEDATKKIEYSRGVSLGYCDEHVKTPMQSYSRKQGQFPYALCVIGLFFIVYYLEAFRAAYRGRATQTSDADKKPRDPFRHFIWMTLAGVLLVNGFYWFASRYMC